MKTVIILRSVSGAGKTKFASFLKRSSAEEVVICCADDYFEQPNGEYKFEAEKLGFAHKACQDKFLNSLMAEAQNIVVANTSAREKDVVFYKEEAEKSGYTVFVLTVENRHGGKDIHGVPEETLVRQEEALRNSIKLR